MSTSKEWANMKQVYDYVRYNRDRLPDYWRDKGIVACIEGMCCMVARGKYSDEAIADYYGCTTPLVKQIKISYKKTIDMMKKQLKETTEMFGEGCLDTNIEKLNDDGCVRLVCAIFERYRNEDQ